jgi:hypothetical protein
MKPSFSVLKQVITETGTQPNVLQFGLELNLHLASQVTQTHLWTLLGVGARTHGSEVTDLDAINFDSEVPGHAQLGILDDTHMAGTSEPLILALRSEPRILAPTSKPRSVAPTSEPWILVPSMDSKTNFIALAYSHLFLLPLGFLSSIEALHNVEVSRHPK